MERVRDLMLEELQPRHRIPEQLTDVINFGRDGTGIKGRSHRSKSVRRRERVAA